MHAEGRIESLRDRYRLTLAIHDGPVGGTRVIESASCDDLGGAAAVALALLVRIERSSGAPLTEADLGGFSLDHAQAPPSSRPLAPPTDRRRESAEKEPTAPVAGPEPTSRKWHATFAPILSLDVGALPDPGYGVGLAGGFRHDAVRIVVTGTLWLSRNIATPASGFGADFERRTVELSGCRGWPIGRLEVAPCLTLSVDDVTARGTGAQVVSATRETAWLSAGGELAGFWHLNRWTALVLGIGGRFATSRPRFVIDGIGDVYEVSPAALGVFLGCEWIL
jgi:hypothetical protein